MGSISAHTRPVESLAGYLDTNTSPPHLVLFTADTMGVIKAWDVVKDSTDGPPIWRSTLRDDLEGHRTRINEIVYGNGHLWSGKKSQDSSLTANRADSDLFFFFSLSFCG